MSNSIRLAELQDLPCILEIYEKAREFMRQAGNPDQWGTTHPVESLLQSDIVARQLYVYEAQRQILAVFYYRQGEDPTYLRIHGGKWLNDAPYGVIHRIAVAVQGQGIAARCFDWALAQCPNLRIDTHRDNVPMQQTLAKNGFTRCGIIYLASGDERIAFHKTTA